MAKQTVGRTALGAAICRLIEQYQPEPDRLFNDSVVKEFVGEPLRFLMQFAAMRRLTLQQTEAVAPGLYGTQVCRTRYIDEAVQAALPQANGQLVILGAGLDSRAYRLPGIEQFKVFEVDLPSVQEEKKRNVQRYLGRLPDYVTFCSIDFDIEDLSQVLSKAGFDSQRPTVFIWEAVTQYLSEAAVQQTFGLIGKSAPGSTLVFTYVLRSIIERRSDVPGAERMMDQVAKQAPWVFGLEPAELPDYLKPFNLTLRADVGNAYYQEHYLQPRKRTMPVFEGERVALSVVSR
jgi:methyltransferase (TIGR00027 family)